MEAFANSFSLIFFLFFLLPPALEAFTTINLSPRHEWGTFESSLVQQACYRTRDVEACLSRLHKECGPEEHRGPFSILHAAMKTTINEALRAIELVSRFTSVHGANYSSLSVELRTAGLRAFHEQTALHDCIELLDLSVQELAWSVEEVEKMRGSPNDARRHGNVMAWMSAALGNQDTCLEGFEGTDGHLRDHIKGGVTQVTQLLTNVLGMYKRMHSLAPLTSLRNGTSYREALGFPDWMSPEEKAAVSLEPRRRRPDVVVAHDGSGDYRSIMEAVNKAPDHSAGLYVIYVKRGVYEEHVEVKRKKTRIALVGDGMGKTVITGSRSIMHGWTTFRTATMAVTGMGFIASDMTIRNTAGPQNHQAVALRVDSDCSAFYRCSIEGYQDTLYAHSSRQFYRDCNIYGTIDFIFGNGNIVIQHSQIIARQPLPFQKVTITAQGRKSSDSSTGFTIHGCSVLARFPTYLGRPWKQFSTTVFMQTYLDAQVQPAGWLEWNGDFALRTLFYGEYGNYGPGSSTSGRVNWPGYHILDRATAERFTVRNFIRGQFWLPSTGVRYVPGLF
ncbi:hypothetical protein Taro_051214 [Colocasia esculenta]|uniref:Pectinesterase n=1 Tax=Colocasia esculenta TaxID=4460 RepID=A0A843XFY2_COLES|nr:hypothetical protein [Colocasia esculenta]